MKMNRKRWARVRALIATLLLALLANMAISYASGVAVMPDMPKPKAGVAVMPDMPKPKAGVAVMPDMPKPKAGVAVMPDMPKP